jgi:hypothetical protein
MKQKRELRTNNTTNMQWNTIQHHHNFLDHHIADLTMPTTTEHYTNDTESAKKNSCLAASRKWKYQADPLLSS